MAGAASSGLGFCVFFAPLVSGGPSELMSSGMGSGFLGGFGGGGSVLENCTEREG